MMITRLDEAVAWVKTLPDDEQERAANALLLFALERSSDMGADDMWADDVELR